MVELTDTRIKALKASGKQQVIKDGKYPLWLIVEVSGAKIWKWRGKLDGKDFSKSIGKYALKFGGDYSFQGMQLQEARREALRLTTNLKEGILPDGSEAGAEPATVSSAVTKKSGMTVGTAYALYLASDKVSKLADKVQKQKETHFEKFMQPIAAKVITEVTYEDIEEIVRDYFLVLSAKGGGQGSTRLKMDISAFFKWARVDGRAITGLKTNPMADMPNMVSEKKRKRFLSEAELKLLFKALPAANSEMNQANRIELLLRTACRRDEIFSAKWSMLSGDWLTIPETKNGDTHLVWLHPSALALIPKRPKDASDDDPIYTAHPEAVEKAMKRLRAKMDELAGKELENWVLHDFRRTAISTMASFHDDEDYQLVTPYTRARVLNHRPVGVTDSTYDMYDNKREKKAAWMLWNDYLDHLKASVTKPAKKPSRSRSKAKASAPAAATI